MCNYYVVLDKISKKLRALNMKKLFAYGTLAQNRPNEHILYERALREVRLVDNTLNKAYIYILKNNIHRN